MFAANIANIAMYCSVRNASVMAISLGNVLLTSSVAIAASNMNIPNALRPTGLVTIVSLPT